jgi:hypothetical protein
VACAQQGRGPAAIASATAQISSQPKRLQLRDSANGNERHEKVVEIVELMVPFRID